MLCTPKTGLTCNSTNGLCTSSTQCLNTVGSAPNPSACICGTTSCTQATGFFCVVNSVGSKCKKYIGQYHFIRVTSETCADVNGNGTNFVRKILDRDLCGRAGKYLGYGSGYPATNEVDYVRATGCNLVGNNPIVNTRLTSATCSNCFCLVAPQCAFTNGLVLNNGPCFCGSTTCTSSTAGFYCNTATNTCNAVAASSSPSPSPSSGTGNTNSSGNCKVTNGTAINDASCTCGSLVCTSTTGLICFATVGSGTCRKHDLGTFGYELVERYVVV